MPEPTERRRSHRYPIQVPLLHTSRNPTSTTTGIGWTRDLSEGGACVELDRRLSAPTPLQVRLQTEQGAIDLEVQVVWEMETREGDAGSGKGGVLHGVAFSHLAPEQLQALRDLIQSHRQERRAAVRLPLDLAVTCQPKVPAGAPVQGRTEDMSRGGLLLRLAQDVPPGTVIELTLHPAGGAVTVEGEVVWVDPPEKRTPGEPVRHGLRFTALGFSAMMSLGLLLMEAA
jgi:c-di-GMP-binding flagellar brake protein YcgR